MNFKKKYKNLWMKTKWIILVEYRMLDLFDEIGEVAKEISKMSDYGSKKPKFREEIIMELGDAFYSLITVANYYDVDLVDSLRLALEKYEKRIKKWGHAGSEND